MVMVCIGMNVLCRVLNLKSSRHPLARSRRTPTSRLHTEDLLQIPRSTSRRQQSKPRNSSLALLTLGRISRRSRAGVLGAGSRAEGSDALVHVEEGGRGVGEEVDAADGQVAGDHGADGLGLAEVELHGYLGEHVHEIGVGGGDAGGVEEGCYCARGDGDGGCVLDVAGVVLGAAAEGYVLEDEACCWWWEGSGSWRVVLDFCAACCHDILTCGHTNWHCCFGQITDRYRGHVPALLHLGCQHVEVFRHRIHPTWCHCVLVEGWVCGSGEDRGPKGGE